MSATLDLDDVAATSETAIRELATLREQLAAAQKDAERYRWLRDNDWITEGLIEIFWSHEEFEHLFGDELDAAIDKAMEESKC